MPRAFSVLFVSAFAAGVTFVAAQQQSAPAPPADASDQPNIVPVHHEPHHRQVFQYGPMRILDLQIPPKDISWFHSHEWPVLYMTLSTSTTRTQVLGADWGGRGRGAPAGARAGGPAPAAAPTDADGGAAPPPTGRRAGGPPGTTSPRATSTTSYAKMPVTHRLENIGDRLFRAMVVVNETAGDETTTEQAAGFDGKPELTNGWFRAYRLTLAAGQKTPTHRHRAPVVIFQATNGKGFGSGPMKFEFNEPGQWAFFDASAEHEIGNSGTGPLELIEVEVRRK